jgi:N6-L-threonylcarbamoyladenine synthase
MVGVGAAKALSVATGKPIYAVNHLVGHVGADIVDRGELRTPTIALLVSGGHTSLLLVRDLLNDVVLLGETIDDAAGEAFDKSAKMLGLPYPGGPLIDKYARLGNPKAFTFAKPQIEGYGFSFSGVKTSILYFLQAEKKKDEHFIEKNLNDLCASIQYTIISILIKKLIKASNETGIKDICIAGGVSANSGLRKAIQETAARHQWKSFIPKFEYCTDNAAMIAITGYYKYLNNEFAGMEDTASARSSF